MSKAHGLSLFRSNCKQWQLSSERMFLEMELIDFEQQILLLQILKGRFRHLRQCLRT